MMFVSHSVFKDQKIIFNVFGAAFDALLSALKRRIRYVIDSLSSTAFLNYFLEQFIQRFLLCRSIAFCVEAADKVSH